jgi:hypothetical protein
MAPASPVVAQGEESEYQLFDKVSMALSFGSAAMSTTVRLDSRRFPKLGTEITFEKDLGLSSSEVIPAFELNWQVARRHSLRLLYTEVSRDASRQIAKEIQFGDIVIPIEEFVAATFEQQTLGLGYTFWPVIRPRYALGIGLGARIWKLSAGLEVRELDIREEGDFSAPVPFLDMRFLYGITPRTRLTADFGIFEASVGDYKGYQGLIALKIEHLTWKHFGFGGGLDWTKIKVDTAQEDFTGKVKMESAYLLAFGRARW